MPLNPAIELIDFLIVIGYLGGVLAFGLWVGRGQRSTVDYFLGGRSLPWWALLLSIVATETSTVTFLSIPGYAFAQNGDLRFLQITLGYIVGRLLVVFILLPLYFSGSNFTSYQVLENRFGTTSRRATSLLFLVTRNLSDALRLFLSALALQQAIGIGITSCVVGLGVFTIAYTVFGGVKSVVWNDCIQFLIYMVGAIAALGVIFSLLPEGFEQFWQFSQEQGKLRIFDFDPSLTKRSMTFWAGLIGGMFLTGATHGTDQLMVQRYLSAKSQRGAGWAVALSGLIVCAQFALFLLIGAALACFYDAFPPVVPFGEADGDRVFSHFIVNSLPQGLVGLTLAAVFAAAMSTLSSSLNSSATALVNDIYLPLAERELSPAEQLRVSRMATIGFGILQIAIAILSYHLGVTQGTVGKVLAIAGFALGPMLGLYFLAVFTPRVAQQSALVGFFVGLAVLSWIFIATNLHWAWYAAVGSISTFAVGYLFSWYFDESQTDNQVSTT
ncbi:MAG: sodium:solute symporter [Planctomycetales bacterium]|nr:sodium:solute symporter [Planctomycetales bacterium]